MLPLCARTLAVLLLATACSPSATAPVDDRDRGGKADDPSDVDEPTLESTALALHLSVDPRAPLVGDDTEDAVDAIIAELTAVAGELLQDDALAIFYSPLPWERGLVMFGATGELADKIATAMGSEDTLDLTEESVGDGAFDALIADRGATRIDRIFGDEYELWFDVDQNALVVAEALAAFGDAAIEYAETSAWLGNFGGTHIEWLSRDWPSVYLFQVGWGDCPAGCTERNRTYVEIYAPGSGQPTVELIGRTGDDLPEQTFDQIYKY